MHKVDPMTRDISLAAGNDADKHQLKTHAQNFNPGSGLDNIGDASNLNVHRSSNNVNEAAATLPNGTAGEQSDIALDPTAHVQKNASMSLIEQ